jgi:two-component system, OmpR family, osmolarity sensor histidine kinase EnvZ
MIDESRVPTFETEPAALETAPVPLELRRPREVSLFWRTFFLLALLLVGCIVAWLQTFRALEFEPRTLQSAQQLASLVNLSRAALVHSDSIARVSLVKTMADEEKVRIAPREPSDKFRLYDADPLSRTVSAQLGARLGPDTVVAREVNGTPGLWIGFSIDGDPYWLQADPSRVELVTGKTWVIWLSTAAVLSLMGAALIARLINRPLQKLSFAASRVRDGDFNSSRLNEAVATSEIRQVNIGFNRMAQRLSKIEQDRALMLAGISHDLRTPLARLRLETEMSVADAEAREHMSADIEQVNAIIDKFLDYARPDHIETQRVSLNEVIEASVFALGTLPDVAIKTSIPPDTCVMGDAVELNRVFSNLLQNAVRYGRNPITGVAEIDIGAKTKDQWVLIKLRDHGPGVHSDMLAQLTQPFFRGDASRSAATGTGLGLSIVERAIERMGGRFALANSSSGGLAAHIKLPVSKKD